MKTLLTTIALMLIIGFTSISQNPISPGQAQFNAGVGLSSLGIPVYVGLDYGVHPNITIGGEVTARSFKENWNSVHYRHNLIGFSGNGNYHFNNLLDIDEEWDVYAGLNLGFYLWDSPKNYGGAYASGLGLGLQLGGRYYFSDKMGLNLEFGGGNAFSGGKFGISIKL